MIEDFHIHTEFSGDSQTPVQEQLEKAIALGMEELCITDHNDYCVNSGELDFNLDFEAYVACIHRFQKEYEGRLQIRLGVEMGLQPHLGQYCLEIARRYPFDFIIGSIHYIHGKDPYYPEYFQGRSTQEAYMEYFDTVLSCIQSCNDFDVLGHLDYVLRYGPKDPISTSDEPFYSRICEVLSLLIQKGKGLECNTCGFRYGLGQPNPSSWILKTYRNMGGEIVTIGSDAHVSDCLGSHFHEAAELLKDCGFSHYTVFRKRKPFFFKL